MFALNNVVLLWNIGATAVVKDAMSVKKGLKSCTEELTTIVTINSLNVDLKLSGNHVQKCREDVKYIRHMDEKKSPCGATKIIHDSKKKSGTGDGGKLGP